MKLKSMGLVIVLLAVGFMLPAQTRASDDTCRQIGLFDPWARSTMPGAPNGAAFGLLVNLGDQPDTLLSVTTAVAAAELHQTTMSDGVMQMRPIDGGIVVPARGYVELAPGGFHMMLIGLKQPLNAGDSLDLILQFEHAGAVAVTVPVRDMAEQGVPMAMDSGETGLVAGATEVATPLVVDPACRGLHILSPWARPNIPGAPNSAAYALVLNLTDADETLIAATSAVAAAVELHEMTVGDDNTMVMRPVEGGIVIPAGGAVVLQPGGAHLMLIGLTEELPVGSTFDVTLTFAAAGDVTISVPVAQPDDTAIPGM